MDLSLLRHGGLRALVSPFLTVLFAVVYSAVWGVSGIPSIQALGHGNVLWVACLGFAIIELLWPCTKDGRREGHTVIGRIAYAIILGLGFGGIGFGCLAVIAQLTA